MENEKQNKDKFLEELENLTGVKVDDVNLLDESGLVLDLFIGKISLKRNYMFLF